MRIYCWIQWWITIYGTKRLFSSFDWNIKLISNLTLDWNIKWNVCHETYTVILNAPHVATFYIRSPSLPSLRYMMMTPRDSGNRYRSHPARIHITLVTWHQLYHYYYYYYSTMMRWKRYRALSQQERFIPTLARPTHPTLLPRKHSQQRFWLCPSWLVGWLV